MTADIDPDPCIRVLLTSLQADRQGRRTFKNAWERGCARAYQRAWELDRTGDSLPLALTIYLTNQREQWRDSYNAGDSFEAAVSLR